MRNLPPPMGDKKCIYLVSEIKKEFYYVFRESSRNTAAGSPGEDVCLRDPASVTPTKAGG